MDGPKRTKPVNKAWKCIQLIKNILYTDGCSTFFLLLIELNLCDILTSIRKKEPSVMSLHWAITRWTRHCGAREPMLIQRRTAICSIDIHMVSLCSIWFINITVLSWSMWCISPYSSGLLHWGNRMIAPVPVQQPWRVWVNSTVLYPHQITEKSSGRFY